MAAITPQPEVPLSEATPALRPGAHRKAKPPAPATTTPPEPPVAQMTGFVKAQHKMTKVEKAPDLKSTDATLVQRLIAYLSNDDYMKMENFIRGSGSKKLTDKILKSPDCLRTLPKGHDTVMAVCSALATSIENLRPIFSQEGHQQFLKAGELLLATPPNEAQAKECLKKALETVPKGKLQVLTALMHFFEKAANAQASRQSEILDAKGIAICYQAYFLEDSKNLTEVAQNTLKAESALVFLIEQQKALFTGMPPSIVSGWQRRTG